MVDRFELPGVRSDGPNQKLYPCQAARTTLGVPQGRVKLTGGVVRGRGTDSPWDLHRSRSATGVPLRHRPPPCADRCLPGREVEECHAVRRGVHRDGRWRRCRRAPGRSPEPSRGGPGLWPVPVRCGPRIDVCGRGRKGWPVAATDVSTLRTGIGRSDLDLTKIRAELANLSAACRAGPSSYRRGRTAQPPALSVSRSSLRCDGSPQGGRRCTGQGSEGPGGCRPGR